jgi:hypothetical protein
MKRAILGTIGAAALCCVALVTRPQTPPATPKRPSADQQSVDEQQCYDWSKTQTGIDPQAPPPAAAPAEARESKAGSAQSAQTQRQETFKKAMGTCLQGRGYTTG